MTMMQATRTPTQYVDTVEVAKLIRASLREAYPGVKFSVRSDRYAGGSSVHIGWTDGPTERQVEAITARFQGASFDGMTDMKTYHSSLLDGAPVRFSADFVFTRRRMTRDFASACGAKAARRFGFAEGEWTLVGSDSMGWHPVADSPDRLGDMAFGRHAASYTQVVAKNSPTAARVGFTD